MDKYKNKYRIKSARLPNWDYGSNATYFVTICTQNRECWFGKIVDGVMDLSNIGNIVKSEWLKTFEMRPDMNLWMGEYVVMPNHFHAIIGIGKNKYNSERGGDGIVDDVGDGIGNDGFVGDGRDAMHCVSTTTNETTNETTPSTPPTGNSKFKNKFGPQSKNLASIIRGFKIGVTKNARLIHPDFAWQPRYHDHIIRNDASFQRIKTYIMNNPKNWDEDKFNEP